MAVSIPPVLKRYSIPLFLFTLGLFFQIVVLPSSFPPTHYAVLGVKTHASVQEVTEAYEKLSAKWFSGSTPPTTIEFIKIRYAYEMLTNPIWKRDYDLFGIDEQLHVIEKLKKQYDGVDFSKIEPPLLNASIPDLANHGFNALTPEEFVSITGKGKAVLIQVYSAGSPRCAQFLNSWKRITNLLEGVAETGMVELGDVQVAAYLAEKKYTRQPFFRNGLPALVAFPPNCRSGDCYVRYQGELSVYEIVDWMATSILGLPRIYYYSKEALAPNFMAKTGQHKVKVICFSKTGERAAPFLRQAAKDYGTYASFAFILWREEDSSIWWNSFGVESAPAIVFLKDPGSKPVVYHGLFLSYHLMSLPGIYRLPCCLKDYSSISIIVGSLNSSEFITIMEENKHKEPPQLRSVTSMELGCDARGYSRAGNDTKIWYCVIVAGRPSHELSKMRDTMCRVRNVLLDAVDPDNANKVNFSVQAFAAAAAAALKENRLTFTWLDGELQKKYCMFYLFSDDAYETCGPRRYGDLTDVPRLFIVRYKRNSTEANVKVKKWPQSIWDTLSEQNANFASQLVARYKGSQDIYEIVRWLSEIVEDGDTKELPYSTQPTPDLIPEDANPIWSRSNQGMLSARNAVKEKIRSIAFHIGDYMRDPRIGPGLLLGACISFGTVWLKSSQTTQPTKRDEGTSSRRASRRHQNTRSSNHDRPPSITDSEPKDAYQLLSTDSDSE
ncbi:DnaJ subfamily C member 10 [Cocos nucifera]|uniref:DnaJ subfamily C member 10 n=1 Tax=Cocos nucifera TaxID=13894 RepID=A0A8K0I240_COCNU|nr:DnaJ subfamily C member 10 [Cocos nucifera]